MPPEQKSEEPTNQIPNWVHSGSLEKVDPDEKLIAIIKRHPFGIIVLYIEFAIGIAAGLALIAFLLPSFTDTSNGTTFWWLKVATYIVIGLLFVVLIVATIIYRQSMLVLTDKTITQVLQEGLINRKVSQLAFTDIEDVTANRRGIFATILNFGTLYVETAGAQENFDFKYCPNPDHYAKLILEGRQHFIERGSE